MSFPSIKKMFIVANIFLCCRMNMSGFLASKRDERPSDSFLQLFARPSRLVNVPIAKAIKSVVSAMRKSPLRRVIPIKRFKQWFLTMNCNCDMYCNVDWDPYFWLGKFRLLFGICSCHPSIPGQHTSPFVVKKSSDLSTELPSTKAYPCLLIVPSHPMVFIPKSTFGGSCKIVEGNPSCTNTSTDFGNPSLLKKGNTKTQWG